MRAVAKAVAATVVAVVILGTGLRAWGLMSPAEERRLGAKAMAQLRHQLKFVSDPEVVAYIQALGRKLAAHAPPCPFTYRFYVASSPEMNAMALPGGYIVIFSGMISALHSEAELAGVMAHEMSHVAFRHLAKRMDKSGPVTLATMAGILAGMIVGQAMGAQAVGQAIAMGSVAGSIQKQLAYSRQDEQEADWSAARIMCAAGYPPSAMVACLRRLWRREHTLGPEVPGYLRTHPLSSERIEAIEGMIRAHPCPAHNPQNFDFNRIKVRLIALTLSPPEARDIFARLLQAPSTRPWGHYGLALMYMRQGNYPAAMKQLESLSGWDGRGHVLKLKGICLLDEGKWAQALKLLERARTRLPSDPALLMAIARAQEALGMLEPAAQNLTLALALPGPKAQVHYQLGVVLGRMGNKALAAYHLGMAFKLRGERKTAEYHLRNALKLLPAHSPLRQKVRAALRELHSPPREG